MKKAKNPLLAKGISNSGKPLLSGNNPETHISKLKKKIDEIDSKFLLWLCCLVRNLPNTMYRTIVNIKTPMAFGKLACL